MGLIARDGIQQYLIELKVKNNFKLQNINITARKRLNDIREEKNSCYRHSIHIGQPDAVGLDVCAVEYLEWRTFLCAG